MKYLISDTHFNHKNIIKYCNRPFDDVNEMNKVLIDNWNSIVNDDDIVYHLGDFALGREESLTKIVRQLKGKIYLLKGNHDHFTQGKYESLGIKFIKDKKIVLEEEKLVLSHKPLLDSEIPESFINVHGHIHDKNLHECIEKYNPKLYNMLKHINISCDVTEFKPVLINQIYNLRKN